MKRDDFIADFQEKLLITGANGFIGTRVVKTLLDYGFCNLRCFVRPTGNINKLLKVVGSYHDVDIDIFKGNLLAPNDCYEASEDAVIIFHLAAGIEKSFPGCFMNSVVTTRNLLNACSKEKRLKRFLNVSSFAVYSPSKLKRGHVLDETCEVERYPHLRGDAYCYGKVKQDELVQNYGKIQNIPYSIVRPGVVYGPGKNVLSGRIGIGTFGIFLHMGGSNQIPLTYVDNCAEAIVLAGLKEGFNGEVFNIVDDDLPTSHEFLKLYKKNVEKFNSIRIHHRLSQLLCILWEKYSKWSNGQLPPAFNRRRWVAEWKGYRFDNSKLKKITGWQPRVTTQNGLAHFFRFAKESRKN
jgi:nucleoside-diphosphate-sugar epimerase